MPGVNRLGPAFDAAVYELEVCLIPDDRRRAQRANARRLIDWVFNGRKGITPSDFTPFERNTAREAVDCGLEHAYSDIYRHEIPEAIQERLREL